MTERRNKYTIYLHPTLTQFRLRGNEQSVEDTLAWLQQAGLQIVQLDQGPHQDSGNGNTVRRYFTANTPKPTNGAAKYLPVQQAADHFINELLSLPAQERDGWLVYLFELTEAAFGTETLESAANLIQARLQHGGW